MSKRVSQLSTLSAAALDDTIPILDESAGVLKRISVQNLVGYVDFGWTASGESWSYSAWDSTYKIGTITVPSDATTKYAKGQFVKFSQSTGGTKYGKIIQVVSSTSIKVFMGSYTLNNEAISSPQYSIANMPIGVSQAIATFEPYKFQCYRATTQNFSLGVATKVQFATEDYDPSSIYDAATNYRFTAPVAGYYDLASYLEASNTAADVLVSIYKNGSEFKRFSRLNFTGFKSLGGAINVLAAASDYFEVYIYSTNTDALSGGSIQSNFQGRLREEA